MSASTTRPIRQTPELFKSKTYMQVEKEYNSKLPRPQRSKFKIIKLVAPKDEPSEVDQESATLEQKLESSKSPEEVESPIILKKDVYQNFKDLLDSKAKSKKRFSVSFKSDALITTGTCDRVFNHYMQCKPDSNLKMRLRQLEGASPKKAGPTESRPRIDSDFLKPRVKLQFR